MTRFKTLAQAEIFLQLSSWNHILRSKVFAEKMRSIMELVSKQTQELLFKNQYFYSE
jgi:hypothetical protein